MKNFFRHYALMRGFFGGGSGDANSDGNIDVTGATVGQTVKIAAVDANGVPTTWEPADFPSGGGKLEFIGTFNVEAGVSSVTFNLGGDYSRVFIADASPASAALTSGEFFVYINRNNANPSKVGKSNRASSAWNYSVMTVEAVNTDSNFSYANFTVTSGSGNGATGNTLSGTNIPQIEYLLYPIQNITFTASTADATFNNKQYSFWGVRA